METQVVIIGAGPVGLYSAARLGQQGISVIVVERNQQILRHGSKALCIQADVLDLLEKVDCKSYLLAKGCPWNRSTTFVGDVEVKRELFKNRRQTPPFLNIAQWEVEESLYKKALETQKVKFLWGHEFKSLEQDSDNVRVIIECEGLVKTINSRFAIAADGSRSSVRNELNAPGVGKRHADRFLIVDMTAELDWPKERRFWFDAVSNPGRQIVMHPHSDNGWRIDWQLATNSDPAEAEAVENVSRRVRALIGPDIPFTLDWISTYRFNQYHLTQLKMGNVLFAGDAAHSFPPFGARGMNSGLQDAENLSWKIIAILVWGAAGSLLDTYHEERYLAAKENIEITRKTIRFMVPPTVLHRWYRNALLKVSAKLRSGKAVNSGKMSQPTVYTKVSTVHAEPYQLPGSSIIVGQLLSQLGQFSKFIRSHIGHNFTIMLGPAVLIEKVEEIQSTYGIHGNNVFILQHNNLTETADQELYIEILNSIGTDVAVIRPDGYLIGASSQNVVAMLEQCFRSHGMSGN